MSLSFGSGGLGARAIGGLREAGWSRGSIPDSLVGCGIAGVLRRSSTLEPTRFPCFLARPSPRYQLDPPMAGSEEMRWNLPRGRARMREAMEAGYESSRRPAGGRLDPGELIVAENQALDDEDDAWGFWRGDSGASTQAALDGPAVAKAMPRGGPSARAPETPAPRPGPWPSATLAGTSAALRPLPPAASAAFLPAPRTPPKTAPMLHATAKWPATVPPPAATGPPAALAPETPPPAHWLPAQVASGSAAPDLVPAIAACASMPRPPYQEATAGQQQAGTGPRVRLLPHRGRACGLGLVARWAPVGPSGMALPCRPLRNLGTHLNMPRWARGCLRMQAMGRRLYKAVAAALAVGSPVRPRRASA